MALFYTRARPATWLATCVLASCASAPSPLSPGFHGSIGRTDEGVLSGGAVIHEGDRQLRFLRQNERHYALARFARSIERAAKTVAQTGTGAPLVVGDLSTKNGGGPLPPHLSHRSGRDADLLFYVTTLEGAPVESPGFVHFGPDGLGYDAVHRRFLRLDVKRQWLLLRTLLLEREARVQFCFVSDAVKAMLLAWAEARGEPVELRSRAAQVMVQPNPGGVHDDHFHLRSSCSLEEQATGCLMTGPRRGWLEEQDDEAATGQGDALAPSGEEDAELAAWLLSPTPR